MGIYGWLTIIITTITIIITTRIIAVMVGITGITTIIITITTIIIRTTITIIRTTRITAVMVGITGIITITTITINEWKKEKQDKLLLLFSYKGSIRVRENEETLLNGSFTLYQKR